MALSEVQQTPSRFQSLTPEQAQSQLMAQLDVRIQSLLVKGQLLERQGDFERAISELQSGRALLEQHFGPQHPMFGDFAQAMYALKL